METNCNSIIGSWNGTPAALYIWAYLKLPFRIPNAIFVVKYEIVVVWVFLFFVLLNYYYFRAIDARNAVSYYDKDACHCNIDSNTFE